MKKHLALLATLVIVLSACSDNESKVEPTPPAYFTMSPMSKINGKSAATSEDVPGFNLGDIRASKEFLFILGNGGNAAIEDISLETNNGQFVISPRHIDRLPGKNSSDNVVTPLISLDVIHGIQLNGVGTTDLLSSGVNETTITIIGTVVIDGKSTVISSAFNIQVDAKVLDITLYSNDAAIDYNDFTGQWIGFEYESGLPAIPGYDFDPENFKIKNTGSVSTQITLSRLATGIPVSFMLEPGETSPLLDIPVMHGDGFDRNFAQITIDGFGTISDRSRVKLGVDGKGYMIVSHQE